MASLHFVKYFFNIRRCPYLGGIFAQSSTEFNTVNMHNRAPEDLENAHDISYILHYHTPGGTQRGDVVIHDKGTLQGEGNQILSILIH